MRCPSTKFSERSPRSRRSFFGCSCSRRITIQPGLTQFTRTSGPRLTASVGVATHGGDGTVSFGGLVKRASDALGRARAAGGDRAEPADPPKKRERISIG